MSIENDVLVYEGQWNMGIPEGKGIKYGKKGVKKFEGDFKKGLPQGHIIEYWPNG